MHSSMIIMFNHILEGSRFITIRHQNLWSGAFLKCDEIKVDGWLASNWLWDWIMGLGLSWILIKWGEVRTPGYTTFWGPQILGLCLTYIRTTFFTSKFSRGATSGSWPLSFCKTICWTIRSRRSQYCTVFPVLLSVSKEQRWCQHFQANYTTLTIVICF